MIRPLLRLLVCLVMALPPALRAEEEPVVTLAATDALYQDILAASQEAVETLVGQPLLLAEVEAKVQGDFAFVATEIQNPDGSAIDFSTTNIADWAAGDFDGPHLWSYLKRADGRWSVLEQDIGPTDAWFAYWPEAHGGSCALTGLTKDC